jgi:CRISPR-associated helicase Cas3/CRISPR-associated endonuclease Cas3-HD
MDYFAHSSSGAGGEFEPLHEHLALVGERAARYASAFGAAEEARLAGLMHDLGKYSDLFQRRLKGEAHGLDHWTPGLLAMRTEWAQGAMAAALAVQGHHVGLQSAMGKRIKDDLRALLSNHPLGLRLTETSASVLLERFSADGLKVPPAPEQPLFSSGALPVDGMLDVRMLFSALVDADYIETEAHFNRSREGQRAYRQEGATLDADAAWRALQAHMDEVRRKSEASEDIAAVRNDLFTACTEAAKLDRGTFTLSAPTGSGKTLAMLAFALLHAQKHNLRRVVIVIPYLTIIEQTVRIYRAIFEKALGLDFVLEHHSLSGSRPNALEEDEVAGRATENAAICSENWDAPLVVTTSVQCLQSLFANRPGACRKLHRLANSVILFDEVQTIPGALAVPTLAALSHLSARYGASVVFSTATQPAFAHLDSVVKRYGAHGWQPREIVASPGKQGSETLFQRSRRTQIHWDIETSTPWTALAKRLADLPRVLCIVNLKRHALLLTKLLTDAGVPDVFHLSTNMCPAHREVILKDVEERLKVGSCRVIATQCVEAGVDIDFPVVYRALGPLESIAQAAGRCNRHGNSPERRPVWVFRPEPEPDGKSLYPPGGYEQATDMTMALYKERGEDAMDIDEPSLFETYYKRLYDLMDGAKVSKNLDLAIKDLDFVATAENYRVINKDAINLLVPYDKDAFATLRQRLMEAGRLTRPWIAAARPYTVSLFRPQANQGLSYYLEPSPSRQKPESDWFILLKEDLYDSDTGLESIGVLEALMIG